MDLKRYLLLNKFRKLITSDRLHLKRIFFPRKDLRKGMGVELKKKSQKEEHGFYQTWFVEVLLLRTENLDRFFQFSLQHRPLSWMFFFCLRYRGWWSASSYQSKSGSFVEHLSYQEYWDTLETPSGDFAHVARLSWSDWKRNLELPLNEKHQTRNHGGRTCMEQDCGDLRIPRLSVFRDESRQSLCVLISWAVQESDQQGKKLCLSK